MERDRSLEGYKKHSLSIAFLSDRNPECSQIHVERMECPPTERL